MGEEPTNSGSDQIPGDRVSPVDVPGAESVSAAAGAGNNVVDAQEALKAGKVSASAASSKKTKPAARTGTMGKTKEGKAKAETNGRTRVPAQNVERVAEVNDIWWLNGKNYYMRAPSGNREWMLLTESRLTRRLELLGLENGERNNPRDVQRLLTYVEDNRKLDAVMNIAGHKDGVIQARSGEQVLVTRGPKLIKPVKGDWSALRRLLELQLVRKIESRAVPAMWRVHVKHDAVKRGVAVWEALTREVVDAESDGCEQWVYDGTLVLFTWLKLRLELLHRRIFGGEDVRRNAPILVLCGPPDAYKSFIQGNVIAPLFGGRQADPSRYLTGATNFNGELIASELLSMGDSPLGTSGAERQKLGEYIKKTIGQADQTLEMKGLDAVGAVFPLWSFVWTINDDKNNLMQLPQMVEGVVDKLVVLHTNPVLLTDENGEPLRTDDLDDYTRFGESVQAQLPAFVHFLLHEFEIPEALKGGRWGMVAVQAPEIIEEMFDDSREGNLLEIIDAARWVSGEEKRDLWQYTDYRPKDDFGTVDENKRVWQGSALQLMNVMKDTSCNLHQDWENAFKKGQRLDMMMSRLAKQKPDRIGRPGKDGRVHRGSGPVKREWIVWRA